MKLRKFILPGLVVAALAASTAPAFASTSSAQHAAVTSSVTQGVGIQLLDNGPPGPPAYGTQDTWIGRVYYGHIPDPIVSGTTRNYTEKVYNTGNITETIKVYSAPATMTNGVYSWSITGTNAASSWTQPSISTLTLAPGASQKVGVAITVPAGTPAGSYYAVVLAGIVPPGGSGNVTLVTMAGNRELLTVTNP